MKNIVEDNRLIAEFMGLTNLNTQSVSIFKEPNLKYFRVSEYKKDGLCEWCHNGVSHGHNQKCYVLDQEKLKYNSSWDWLMPVIEKIEETTYEETSFYTIIGYKYCEIESMEDVGFESIDKDGNSKLEATYKAGIEFIKWHNESTGN
jgi:hypothetical protein